VGGATGPIVVGRIFDRLGSYQPATIQLLALPALVPCLLMFLLPHYADQEHPETIAFLDSVDEVPAEVNSQ
jgi:hypothetical protein